MAVAEKVNQELEFDEKIIRQHIAPQEFLKKRYELALDAEILNNLKPVYLASILDYLIAVLKSRVRKGSISQQTYDAYMTEWTKLDQEYGHLSERRFFSSMSLKEWRNRFVALDELIDLIGMGTSEPASIQELPEPMAMWGYHECPEDCPYLVQMRQERQKYE